MGLRIYNSLSRQIEEFTPLRPRKVGFYKCGMTVYGPAHLGHAKSGVHFDAMVRWLRVSGYDVTYVQNITDVGHLTQDSDDGEDPVTREARKRGLHPMAVAEAFSRAWLDDMDALHMLRPDIMPRATGHVPEQIEMCRELLEKGHAYEVNGSVYFDVASFPGYGRLSGRSVAEQEAGTRVELRSEKRHPADFALWKRAEGGHIMRWQSPWGWGFPGWHLECSAMARQYLGDTVDIHGGGLDNQFPHHECEIAQSECCTGKPFVRYWLHNNMCTINGQKMAKSLGNGVLIRDAISTPQPLLDRSGQVLLERAYEPTVVRHFILTSHYRASQDFSNDALIAAESGSYKLRDAFAEVARAARSAASRPASDAVRTALSEIEKRFADAMNEDFNTAAAIAVLFDFARQCRSWVADGAGREDLATVDTLARKLAGDALGLIWRDTGGSGSSKQDDLIKMLIEMRQEARKSKNFALSDQIRDRLLAIGIELRDGPQGTTWSAS
ncbi:MAG: cysteine--tRNA ligase [Planctomycetes bacterium]|nr:cysteine--tRNA ligase [Planctomycetota bacterium]